MHMIAVVDKMGNAVHPIVPPDVHDGICCTPTYTSVLPNVHDGICSIPAGKYSTPSEAPDAHDGCYRLGGKCGLHPSVPPDVYDGICSTPTGKYSTPSEAPY